MYTMHRWQTFLIAMTCVTLGAACGSVPIDPLAPGADHVRLTQTPGDVATCKPVGNILVPNEPGTDRPDWANATHLFLNQVVGLGGNAALVTSGVLAVPVGGIAYQCP
jgi:hypothetical protein